MKLKLDDAGHVVVVEGKPVYVTDDGKDIPFDVAGTKSTIDRLNGEAKANRLRAEGAEEKLKGFTGIDDPASALKALETMKNLDQKKLIDAGEVERVKSEISKVYDQRLADAAAKATKFEQQLIAEMIGGNFARSKMIAEKLSIPSDMAQAAFGNAFKIVDGKVVGHFNGNPIFSPARPGEIADFDEALGYLVENYPSRDRIMKGSGQQGSGGQGSGQGGAGKKELSRSQFEALPPIAQRKHFKDGGTLTDG